MFITNIRDFILYKGGIGWRWGRCFLYRYKKIQTFYPKKLKFYFFRLLRRLGRDAHGKLVFARNDNIPFWSPSLSNKCKIHGNNCPIYCCYNTHNKMIKESRDKNFNTNFNIKGCKKKLEEKEVLNLWKRPDLKDKKEKYGLSVTHRDEALK